MPRDTAGTVGVCVCIGAEGRVAGLAAERGVDDIGIGLRPDLVGRGNGRLGFERVDTHQNARGRYVVLTRSWP